MGGPNQSHLHEESPRVSDWWQVHLRPRVRWPNLLQPRTHPTVSQGQVPSRVIAAPNHKLEIRDLNDEYMSTSTPKSRRVVFWVCFLAVVGVCIKLALSCQIRRGKAQRTVELLRSMVASDPRFQKVTASYGTNGSAWLNGNVSSEEDLRALRTLVEQGHLPMQPGISVHVDSPPQNVRAEPQSFRPPQNWRA